MSNISKRLQSVIKKEFQKSILPIKTDRGILVGNVLIVNSGTVKNIEQYNEVVFQEVHLNCAAIAIANLLATARNQEALEVFKADQHYSRSFIDSQLLRLQFEKAINNKEYFKADVLWARYLVARDRTVAYKTKAESLSKF